MWTIDRILTAPPSEHVPKYLAKLPVVIKLSGLASSINFRGKLNKDFKLVLRQKKGGYRSLLLLLLNGTADAKV